MYQIATARDSEVCGSCRALCTLELLRIRVDDAVVVQAIDEGYAIQVVDALLKAASNSILADGIFCNCTVWRAHCRNGEGT